MKFSSKKKNGGNVANWKTEPSAFGRTQAAAASVALAVPDTAISGDWRLQFACCPALITTPPSPRLSPRLSPLLSPSLSPFLSPSPSPSPSPSCSPSASPRRCTAQSASSRHSNRLQRAPVCPSNPSPSPHGRRLRRWNHRSAACLLLPVGSQSPIEPLVVEVPRRTHLLPPTTAHNYSHNHNRPYVNVNVNERHLLQPAKESADLDKMATNEKTQGEVEMGYQHTLVSKSHSETPTDFLVIKKKHVASVLVLLLWNSLSVYMNWNLESSRSFRNV